MQLFRAGRQDAFGALVARHQRMLMNFFGRMGVDESSAQDCAQETFLRLLKYRDTYRESAPFKVFLLRLARHAWVDWVRRGARRKAGPIDAETCAAGEKIGAVDARLDLEAALAALPEHLRAAMVLSVQQGLSYAEIAHVLDVPVGTVKSRVFYAVRRLREVLNAKRTQ